MTDTGSWTTQGPVQAGIPNRIFWPSLAALTIILVTRNLQQAGHRKLHPHVLWLLGYALFAGASVAWALKPEASFVRYAQQVMILASVMLPPLLISRPVDLLRGVSLCFIIAVILNICFLFDDTQFMIKRYGGYYGYFGGKNYLGEFSSIACLLCFYQARQHGVWRIIGICVLPLAITLLILANSKTALGLTLIIPFLSWVIQATWKKLRVSPAIFVALLILFYNAGSALTGVTSNRLSYLIYNDSTFTGRTIIWGFVRNMIDQRPQGWGYQSFWLVGPDSPNIVYGWGFIKIMPNGHNGYYDTMLDLGYFGFILLIGFIFATLHAICLIADRDPIRAHVILSICLMVMFHNFLESIWMRGFEFQWIMFLIMAAEIARFQRSAPASVRRAIALS